MPLLGTFGSNSIRSLTHSSGGVTYYGNGSQGGYRGGNGGQGVVRVIWGTGRSWPLTNTNEDSSNGNITNY